MRSQLLALATLVALPLTPACHTCASEPATSAAAIVWTLAVHDQPATCAAVGAVSASLQLRDRRGTVTSAVFPCTDAHGTTPPIVAGPYDATLTLLGADDAVIATGPTQPQIAIAAGQITELAGVRFTATDHGELALSLVAIAATTNCGPAEQGGAGLTGFALDFEHAADGCAPVTFTRARHGVTLGTYTVDCGSPVVTSCIERDEILTVDRLDAGPYAIGVEALRGPLRCWAAADVVRVAGGTSTAQRIELGPQQAPGC